MLKKTSKTSDKKKRLDVLLKDRGITLSRQRAQALIMAGHVYCGEQKITKPGTLISVTKEVVVRGKDHPWASRAGLKLDHALKEFRLEVLGLTAVDIGASSGGFTDVLLVRGVSKVYAVDVGFGQLDWRLRQDPRVVVLEKTNARYLVRSSIPSPFDLIVCDTSFISLKKVLPATLGLAEVGATLVALIKPQFEGPRDQVSKGGVVNSVAAHKAICNRIQLWLQDEMNWTVLGMLPSPIKGPAGNREFFIAAKK